MSDDPQHVRSGRHPVDGNATPIEDIDRYYDRERELNREAFERFGKRQSDKK